MARPGVLQHRKFLRLVHDLGVPAPHALGHLEVMWHRCYESTDDLLGDRVDVELAAGWAGEAGSFAAAAIRIGWIDEGEDGACRVHDLWDHAPDYVSKRWKREQERRERGQTISDLRREAGRRGGLATAEHAAAKGQQTDSKRRTLAATCSTSGDQTAANGATPAPAPAPAPAREEATPPTRRPADGAPGREPVEPPVLVYPVTAARAGGEVEWGLGEAKVAEWRECFPGLDVLAECRKALQWVRDNPTRRKTAKGMLRFLGGWLERAQNKRGGLLPFGGNGRPPSPTAKPAWRGTDSSLNDPARAALDSKEW